MSTTATIPAQPDYENPPRGIEKLYEVVDGECVESKPAWAIETRTAGNLYQALADQRRDKPLGAFYLYMLYLLRPEPRLARRPDLSFVSFDRWPADKRIPDTEAFDVTPDLAVEMIGPKEYASELLRKLMEYFEAGVRRVWVVYPHERVIHDFASLDEIHVLRGDASLDGGDVLPGYSIKLADLFNAV